MGSDNIKILKFDICGMNCAACSARVQSAASKVKGVGNAEVNLLTNTMVCTFDESITSENDIISAVISAGYGAAVRDESKKINPESENEKKAGKIKKRMIISLILLLPLMYLSMGHMIGLKSPFSSFGDTAPLYMALSQAALSLIIMLINRKYYVNGFRSLYKLSPNMDSLIAVGSTASYLYGIFVTYLIFTDISKGDINSAHNHVMDLYFEGAAMIVTLINIGKFLEAKSKAKTTSALSKLINMAPDTAVIADGEEEKTVPVSEVREGDTVIVKPFSRIPVDGTVLSGESSVDESALTGESVPKDKKPGDTVYCASVNTNGYLRIQAEKVGNDTSFSKVIKLVEEASSSKAPISRFADKVAGVFVPVVMGISLLTFIVWKLSGVTTGFALTFAVSVLVISCPCALGLATPVAIMVGTGKGAENGILIKSATALETLGRVKMVVFDKTGTLTEGKPEITGIMAGKNIDAKWLLHIAASLEKESEHPLATAVLRKADEMDIYFSEVSEYESIPGKGIKGTLDEKVYYSGNRRLLDFLECDDTGFREAINNASESGYTVLYIMDEKSVLGILTASDRVRKNAEYTVDTLRKMDITPVMLTGDTKASADRCAQKIGNPKVISQVLPSDKKDTITSLRNGKNITAMVGDGINDAPALAAADVGIAVGSAVDIALDCADMVIINNDPAQVISAVKLSKAVMKKIKENLFWAFFYNCLGIPLAAGVFYNALNWQLSPMFASLAMSFSSFTVVMNALGLRKTDLAIQSNICPGEKCDLKKETEDNNLENINETTIKIEGMMCMHCVQHVTEALEGLEGMTKVTVDLKTDSAKVMFSLPCTMDNIKDAVMKAGYSVKE